MDNCEQYKKRGNALKEKAEKNHFENRDITLGNIEIYAFLCLVHLTLHQRYFFLDFKSVQLLSNEFKNQLRVCNLHKEIG